MIEIKDISFNEYCLLRKTERLEYDYCIEFANIFNLKVDVFEVGDLTFKTFGEVKDIQYDLQNILTFKKLFEHINILTKKSIDELKNYSFLKILQFRNYYVAEIIRICEIENSLLEYIPTDEEKSAGIDNFNSLGVYNQIRNLAGNDVTKIETVRNIKYSDCLLELYARKLSNDFEHELQKIYARKNKH